MVDDLPLVSYDRCVFLLRCFARFVVSKTRADTQSKSSGVPRLDGLQLNYGFIQSNSLQLYFFNLYINYALRLISNNTILKSNNYNISFSTIKSSQYIYTYICVCICVCLIH